MMSGPRNVVQCKSSDGENRARLLDLVDNMTTSGRPQLDDKLVKAVKQLCRQSDSYVKHVFHLLMTRLERNHAEVRLSAFQIARELFTRSHCFRDLLLSHFQHFIELVLAINPKQPLPPPKRAAQELKQQAAEAINAWHETFGKTYKKLAVAYHFLKSHNKVDFTDVLARTSAERRREEAARLKREARDQEKLDKVLKEIQDVSSDIESCVTESQNCITLLLSDHDIFDFGGMPAAKNSSVVQASCSTSEYDDPSCSASEGSSLAPHMMGHASQNVGCDGCNTASDGINDQSAQDITALTETLLNTNEQPESSAASQECSVMNSKCTGSDDEQTGRARCSSDGSDEDFMQDDDHIGFNSSSGIFGREHGVHSFRYALHLDIASHIEIKQTEDNSAIIRDLSDQASLLVNRYMPMVKCWLEALSKIGASQEHIRTVLDLKSTVESAIQRIRKLNVVGTEPKASNNEDAVHMESDDDDDDDDDDLIEVPAKEGFEPYIPGHMREEYGLPVASTSKDAHSWERKERKHDVEDPATLVANVMKWKERQSVDAEDSSDSSAHLPPDNQHQPEVTERRKKMMNEAPVVPYGADLYFWGEKFEAPLINRNDCDSHRWWSTREPDDAVDINALEASKFRVMNYVGSFEPIKWKCWAPLPNGSLCQRMDRFKCPFHGKIIARDDRGQPNEKQGTQNATASSSLAEPSSSYSPAGLNDVELQTDILLTTGIDLRRKTKGRQKKQEGGLTDIRSLKNTAHKRLASKIFNRAAVRRVAEALDSFDAKRVKEKFANSFRSTFRQ